MRGGIPIGNMPTLRPRRPDSGTRIPVRWGSGRPGVPRLRRGARPDRAARDAAGNGRPRHPRGTGPERQGDGRMLVGVPREVKNREYRVALTPAGVVELVR